MASVSEEDSKPSSSTAQPSTSTAPEISDQEIKDLFAKGKRHYICQETVLAYKSFGDVCSKLSTKYGQTANECGEAYLYYGKSLLDIARMENGVLGNALKAGPAVEEDDDDDDDNLPNQESDDDADAEDVDDDGEDTVEEAEATEDGADDAKTEEHPDDVPDMQLAWEMLELARLIFARQQGTAFKLKQADANHTLGEISMELEHYAEAVGDFSECLRLQDPILEADDRLRAETHYNLGLSYTFDKHYEKAIEHFRKAIHSIELRIDNIGKKIEEEQNKKGKGKVDAPLASWRKEVEELKDLLPDMAAKIEDAEETKKSSDITVQAVKAMAKELMGAASGFDAPTISESNSFDAPTSGDFKPQQKKTQASDISHLVRKQVGTSEVSSLVVKKVGASEVSSLVVKKRKKADDSDGDEMDSKKVRQAEEESKEVRQAEEESKEETKNEEMENEESKELQSAEEKVESKSEKEEKKEESKEVKEEKKEEESKEGKEESKEEESKEEKEELKDENEEESKEPEKSKAEKACTVEEAMDTA